MNNELKKTSVPPRLVKRMPVKKNRAVIAGVLILSKEIVTTLDPEGYMSPSQFMTYLATLVLFYKPIKRLARVNVSWQVAKVSAERMLEILALEPTITDPPPDVGDNVWHLGTLDPIERGKINVTIETITVSSSRSPISSETGRSHCSERPKSHRNKMLRIQSRYCWYIGLSRL